MSNNKQSSVEWLWSELRDKFSWETGEMYDSNELVLVEILEQAKAMHKEEVKSAYVSGYLDNGYYEGAEEDAAKLWEDTYGFVHKETFNNNEQQ